MSELSCFWSQVVDWCNANYGFASVVLAICALLLSIVATCISISANKEQAKIGVLQYRLEIWDYFEHVYQTCKQFSETPKERPLIYKRRTASFIYNIGTKERSICEKLIEIEKHIQTAQGDSEKRLLEDKYRETADQLVPSIVNEERQVDEIKSKITLLFPKAYSGTLFELLDVYGEFYIGQSCYDDSGFDTIIDQMKAVITKVDKSNLRNKIKKITYHR